MEEFNSNWKITAFGYMSFVFWISFFILMFFLLVMSLGLDEGERGRPGDIFFLVSYALISALGIAGSHSMIKGNVKVGVRRIISAIVLFILVLVIFFSSILLQQI